MSSNPKMTAQTRYPSCSLGPDYNSDLQGSRVGAGAGSDASCHRCFREGDSILATTKASWKANALTCAFESQHQTFTRKFDPQFAHVRPSWALTAAGSPETYMVMAADISGACTRKVLAARAPARVVAGQHIVTH